MGNFIFFQDCGYELLNLLWNVSRPLSWAKRLYAAWNLQTASSWITHGIFPVWRNKDLIPDSKVPGANMGPNIGAPGSHSNINGF